MGIRKWKALNEEKAVELMDRWRDRKYCRRETNRSRYQVIQRLRKEIDKLQKQVKKKDIQILRLEDELRKRK